jgi:hypothetical protein
MKFAICCNQLCELRCMSILTAIYSPSISSVCSPTNVKQQSRTLIEWFNQTLKRVRRNLGSGVRQTICRSDKPITPPNLIFNHSPAKASARTKLPLPLQIQALRGHVQRIHMTPPETPRSTNGPAFTISVFSIVSTSGVSTISLVYFPIIFLTRIALRRVSD